MKHGRRSRLAGRGAPPARRMARWREMRIWVPLKLGVLIAVQSRVSLHAQGSTPAHTEAQQQPLVALFGTNDPGETSNFSNTVFDVDPARLVSSHRHFGSHGFLHLGLIPGSAGQRIWNVQCEVLGNCNSGTGCGFTASGLLNGWEAEVKNAIDSIGPALSNRSVDGVVGASASGCVVASARAGSANHLALRLRITHVLLTTPCRGMQFLGDELCGTVGIPASNLSAVAARAKAAMSQWVAGGGKVMVNEAIWAVNDTAVGPNSSSRFPRPSPCWLPHIPPAGEWSEATSSLLSS